MSTIIEIMKIVKESPYLGEEKKPSKKMVILTTRNEENLENFLARYGYVFCASGMNMKTWVRDLAFKKPE